MRRTLMCSNRTRGRRYRRSVLVAVVWRLQVVQKTASSLCARNTRRVGCAVGGWQHAHDGRTSVCDSLAPPDRC
jgi:hypothetical protein